MPFTRDGEWVNPVERDIQAFKGTLEPTDNIVQPTDALITAIQSVATVDSEDSSRPIDFFNTVAKLQGPVDIIIPVYGGLHVLKDCVESIQARTSWDYNFIFVDDCSPDPEVLAYLLDVKAKNENVTVLLNKQNRGFAATVNRGIAHGSAPYVCLMNTDVIATTGWLTRMLVALESDPKNCMVNPATNNTALINVDMYEGRSYLDMDTALSRQSQIHYPEILPTGFCFMYRRSLIDEIGPYDEAFGSYGEETDFWFRAINHVTEEGVLLGYKAVMADNVYMFHERGTSFSQLGAGEHMQQRKSGSARFHRIWPQFSEWSKGFNVKDAVGGMRSNIPVRAFHKEHRGNVAWVVKSAGACGGMYYIADIANELIEQGYNVKICLVPDPSIDIEEETFELIGNLRTRPIFFKDRAEFVSQFSDRVFSGPGTLFSAVTELTPACLRIAEANNQIKVYNHVQSWDVDLAESLGLSSMIPQIETMYKSAPNVCVSSWIAEKIKQLGGEVTAVIPPGVNPDLFHDRDREAGDERITFGIMLLPDNPFKGYDLGVEFANALLAEGRRKNQDIRVFAVGTDVVLEAQGVVALGGLSQARIADSLGREIDVLIDPSSVHSYGLPGLEALFSGANYLCWNNKGVWEYEGEFPEKVVVLDFDTPMKEAVEAAFSLVDRESSRIRKLPEDHIRRNSVLTFIDTMIEKEPEPQRSYRIEIISPHMRKHGGPTTLITTANILQASGHNTSMSMCYDDYNPEVVKSCYVPLRTKKWREIGKDVEVTFINSDNPFAKELMEKNAHSKFIMMKLSHNERFLEIENGNLDLPWDHIVTSTDWLAAACIQRMSDKWTHREWDPKHVTVTGWYHYGHEVFAKNPKDRIYGNADSGFRLGTLVHAHPLKGSQEAMSVIAALKKKYEANFHAAGVGEAKAKLEWYMQYFQSLGRKDLAHVFQQFDIWLGASHTEGLGRLSLEAMSAGCALVTTNTGADFLKDRENCLLYEPGDAQKAGELCDELANDKELFIKLVSAGFKTAEENADPNELRYNLEKVIEEVVDGN
jgi:GT2 family glycosyltransferase/glycosyltransferase involved in cell wall biosynthesis